jgi:hypothetical protein
VGAESTQSDAERPEDGRNSDIIHGASRRRAGGMSDYKLLSRREVRSGLRNI